jgi:hypothetical protein
VKDIRPELRARLEAVRTERVVGHAAHKARDAELAARENRLLGLLQDEEREWAVSVAGTNGDAKEARPPETPSLSGLALQFLHEASGGQTTYTIAAAAQNRGYRFKPKGAARSTNMTLQNLAYRNLVKYQGGVWVLTPEGRAEAGKLKSEKEKAQQAA